MNSRNKASYKLFRFWKILGPGLVTGSSDDDPSGIATYSQAGAAYGLSAILYGLTAPVLIAIILHISNNKKIMGKNINGKTSNILGFTALVLMTVAAGILIYRQLT